MGRGMNNYERLASAIFTTPVRATDIHKLRETADTLIDGLPMGQAKFHSRNRAILRARFGLDGEPKGLAEVGNELGLSGERVRQIEAKALRMLRHPSRSRQLSKSAIGGELHWVNEGGPEEIDNNPRFCDPIVRLCFQDLLPCQAEDSIENNQVHW